MQQLIDGITGIYVKSFEFDAPNVYTESDVEAVRKQVSGAGWSRVVSVREKGELTEIYFWKERDTNGGLVVISAETNELTVVNIVGRVDLASLGALGPMIPKLPGATGQGGHRNSYFTVISNNRGHSFPVTKMRFFCASNAMPLSTASALDLRASAHQAGPLRLIQPSTRPSFGEMRTM